MPDGSLFEGWCEMGRHSAETHGTMRPIGASTTGGKMYEHSKTNRVKKLKISQRMIGRASGHGSHRRES